MTDELKQTRERLDATWKQLEDTVYYISHDLRQPLVGIIGFGSLLKEDLQDIVTDQQMHFLDRVIDSARRLDGLIGSLVHLSRAAREVDLDAETDLSIVLETVVGKRSADIRDAGLRVTVAPDLPDKLLGPLHDLERLFGALLENAIVFRADDRSPTVEFGAGPPLENDPEHHHLWVRDNGIGIPEAALAHIFSACFTTGERGASRIGVGLAICWKVVERYGGRIWAESTPGSGSTFHFAWPKGPVQE